MIFNQVKTRSLWPTYGYNDPWVSFKNQLAFTNSVSRGPDIPSWKYLISRGYNATTNLSGFRFVTRRFGGSMYAKIKKAYGVNDLQSTGDNLNWFNPSVPTTVMDASMSAKAASNFLNDYLKQLSAWRGGNSIAELRETIEGAARPGQVLYRQTWDFVGALGKLKKVYRTSPMAYGRAITDAWLGYSLAIKPTVGDIDDAWSALANLAGNLGCFDLLPIVGNAESTSLVSEELLGIPHMSQASSRKIVKLTSSVRYKGSLRCAPAGSYQGVAQNFGVTFDDILPAIWEAIPFSFVLDYFVNMQECLDAIRYLRNEPTCMRVTYRNVLNTVWTDFIPTPDVAHYPPSVSGGRAFVRCSYVNRHSLNEVVYPGLQFRMPGLGSTKWLNIGALAAGFIRTSPYGKVAKGLGL